MGKTISKVTKIVFGVLVVGFVCLFIYWTHAEIEETKQLQKTTVLWPTSAVKNSYSYTGQEGVDALTLLKKNFTVMQDPSGLVVVIGERKAESRIREYWAFYVNGKLAAVGPKDYITKDTDKIEWKIEKY